MPSQVWDEAPFNFTNVNGSTVHEWIRNYIPHFIMNVISDPYWSSNNNNDKEAQTVADSENVLY